MNWRQILSWQVEPPALQPGDSVKIIANKELLNSIDIYFAADRIQNSIGRVTDIFPKSELFTPQYGLGVVVMNWAYEVWNFPLSHWEQFLQIVPNRRSNLKLGWDLGGNFNEFVAQVVKGDIWEVTKTKTSENMPKQWYILVMNVHFKTPDKVNMTYVWWVERDRMEKALADQEFVQHGLWGATVTESYARESFGSGMEFSLVRKFDMESVGL